jgi:Ecdysteroid kinase-like family
MCHYCETIFFVSDSPGKKARVFFLGKPFQLRLILIGNDWTQLEMNKHTSSFCRIIDDEEKGFNTLSPGFNVMIHNDLWICNLLFRY